MVGLLQPFVLQAASEPGFAEIRTQINLGVDGVPVTAIERVRPSFSQEFSKVFTLNATVDGSLHQGRNLQDELERTFSESDLGPYLDSQDCTWPEDQNEFLDVSSISEIVSVERLYLDAYFHRADLRVGRQPVNWGSALIVNPTDPFPEVLALEPWKPRAGVNALRVTFPIGESAQVQAVIGSDDVFSLLRAATKATVSFGQTDVSLTGAWRQLSDLQDGDTSKSWGNGLVGTDIRGTLGLGYWLEAALHVEPQSDPYEEVAVGFDYSFPVLDRLAMSLQYYRNGSADTGGSISSSVLTRSGIQGPECGGVPLFDTSSADPFAPYFLGQDYVMGAVSAAVNTQISASTTWIQNLNDGTAAFVPVVSFTPNGWLELAASAQIPLSLWGDGGELNPSDDDLTLDYPVDSSGTTVTVDFSGLSSDMTFTLWSRVSF